MVSYTYSLGMATFQQAPVSSNSSSHALLVIEDHSWIEFPFSVTELSRPRNLEMPRTQPMNEKGKTGTKGTQHHCPGAKISRYVKEDPCKQAKGNDYCITHQIKCPHPDCQKKNWSHLKYEGCGDCRKREEVSFLQGMLFRLR